MFKLFEEYKFTSGTFFFFLGAIIIAINCACIVTLVPDKIFQVIFHLIMAYIGIELLKEAIDMD